MAADSKMTVNEQDATSPAPEGGEASETPPGATAPPETSPPTASTPTGGAEQEALQAAIQDAVPAIESLRVRRHPKQDQVFYISARIRGETASGEQLKSELARNLLAIGQSRGVVLLPLLQISRGEPPSATETPLPTDPEAIVLSLTDILAQAQGDLSRQRRIVSRALASYVDQLEAFRVSGHVPKYLVLHGINQILEETFAILLSLEGRTFELRADALALFEERYCRRQDVGFATEDVLHYLQSLGEEQLQKELYFLQQEDTADHDIKAHIKRSILFVDAARRYVDRTLVTEAELRQRRRVRLLLAIAGTPLAAALILAIIVAKMPLSAIRDTDVITQPGEIAAVFFADKALSQELFRASTPQINFSRTKKPFVEDAPADRFAVRWEGYINFPEGGEFYLCSSHDDGVRLDLQGERIVDDWHDGAPRKKCGKVDVAAGWHPFKYEYYEAKHTAEARLLWGASEKKVKPVPAENLCCGE